LIDLIQEFSMFRKPVVLTLAAATASAMIVAGCKVGPDYKAPTTQLSATWTEPLGHGPTTQPVVNTRWWTTFDDPELTSLIERAARANLDLRLATSRVRQARAERRFVQADLYPQVNVGGNYSHNRNAVGVAGGGGGTIAAPSTGSEFDLYRAGFDASWELDVFGGIRRNVEAATADLQAQVEARNNTLVSLLAETAVNYVELRGLQARLQIAQENLHAQQQSLELTRTKFRAGLISDLDVSRAEAQVESTAAQIPSLESSIRQSIHRLEVLLAQEPGTLSAELSKTKAIPGVPPVVPVGLPSDLLRRRPDVRSAERSLAAATARIGVATADLFPKFNLTGSLGTQATEPGNLFNSSSLFYSIGPGISWPVFDAGRIRANIEISNAIQEQAFLQWEGTVLQALSDTEVALVAYTQEQARYQRLTASVEANQRSVATATQLYERGLGDFLNVLDAQRALFAAQDAQALSRQTVTTNLVQLYKALGGGWEQPVSPATQPVASSQ
jgi:NodT family efflux transporter outer membrane factor (OMF) lipoprotein